MVKKACVNNSSSGVTPNYLTCNEVYINTCDECSELRAYLSYGHWPVPRCSDKERLSVVDQKKKKHPQPNNPLENVCHEQ